eukprot:COSAG01_NODE_41989_length_444_cov_13.602899_1_plen_107_part_01
MCLGVREGCKSRHADVGQEHGGRRTVTAHRILTPPSANRPLHQRDRSVPPNPVTHGMACRREEAVAAAATDTYKCASALGRRVRESWGHSATTYHVAHTHTDSVPPF